MSMITKHDSEMAKIIVDPVLWAEHHLGQKPRWYQEQILRHPHNRIVLRCGRRLGKCIAGDQRILDATTGAYQTVESLYKRQVKQTSLFSMQDDYTIEASSSFDIQDNGMKEVFEVKTKHGARVELTGNHPVLTIEGWKEVDLLSVGESIAVPKALPAFGSDTPGIAYAKMAGYITATYQETKRGAILSFNSKTIGPEVSALAKELGIILVKKTEQNFFFYDDKGVFDTIVAGRKEGIPEEVFTYDKTHLAVFLSALYDANSWNYSERIVEIGLGSRSNRFSRDVKHLLLRFGIDSNVIQRDLSGRPYYQLMIYSKRHVLSFIRQVAIYGEKDYSETEEYALTMNERENTIPSKIWDMIEERRLEKGLKKYEVTGNKEEKFKVRIGLSEEKAKRYAQNLEFPFLYDLAHSDVYWEEVISITPVGEKQTYDVSVPETHNLIVEDVLVHNTWTMAAHMLWVAFTSNGGKITQGGATCIVATPYDSQAKLIYDQLCTFIDENEVLQKSVKSRTKNPYRIEFHNKSVIKLFTAGTKSGSGGASLRGQAADWLYMDKTLSLLTAK